MKGRIQGERSDKRRNDGSKMGRRTMQEIWKEMKNEGKKTSVEGKKR